MIQKNPPRQFFGVTKCVVRLKIVAVVVNCFDATLYLAQTPRDWHMADSQCVFVG